MGELVAADFLILLEISPQQEIIIIPDSVQSWCFIITFIVNNIVKR